MIAALIVSSYTQTPLRRDIIHEGEILPHGGYVFPFLDDGVLSNRSQPF
jgi:hypothetical protein